MFPGQIRNLTCKQNCHLDRSAPEFPASLHWTRPRMRMMFDNATNFYRKSGVAEWRDLRLDC
jgi:hypothetical protein